VPVLGERYLKVSEVCELLNLSRRAVYNWIRMGWINAIKLPNGEYRIPASEVERLKARRRVF